MKRAGLFVVSLVLVLAVLGLAGCTPGNTILEEVGEINLSNQQQGIWVTGQGKVTVVPDTVSLRLGVEAQEASVAQAQSVAVEAMDGIMAALIANGVAQNDIQTQYFSIYQVTRWDDGEQIVIGYRVTNMVTVKIRDIESAGAVIDAVAVAGGDLVRINSISFFIDDPSAYYEEARQEAMADARAKAEQLATLGGVTLGNPTYISEGTPYSPDYRFNGFYDEGASGTTPISPGETEVSLSVQVIYAISY